MIGTSTRSVWKRREVEVHMSTSSACLLNQHTHTREPRRSASRGQRAPVVQKTPDRISLFLVGCQPRLLQTMSFVSALPSCPASVPDATLHGMRLDGAPCDLAGKGTSLLLSLSLSPERRKLKAAIRHNFFGLFHLDSDPQFCARALGIETALCMEYVLDRRVPRAKHPPGARFTDAG